MPQEPIEFDIREEDEAQQGPTEYDIEVPGIEADVSTGYIKNRDKDLLPYAARADRHEVGFSVEVNAKEPYVEQAKTNAAMDSVKRGEETIIASREEAIDPTEALVKAAEQVQASAYLSKYIDPVVMSTILTGDNELAKRTYLEKTQKVLILHDLISKKVAEADDTPWWRDFDFVDSLGVSIPVYSNFVVKDRRGMASDLSIMLSSDMSAEQFTDEAGRILDYAADGFITQSNKFLLNDFLALIETGGEGAEAATQEFWAWFDTLTLAGGLARPGFEASKKVFNTSEMVADSATLLAKTGHTEAVDTVLRNAVDTDNPVTAATKLGNKHPSVEVTSRDRKIWLSAPEATAMRTIEAENKLLNSFRQRVLPESLNADEYAQWEAEFLQKARDGAPKQVIDHDVFKDEFENIFYSELWGTSTGKYYRSEARASTLATKIGGEVVQVADKQYAVLKQANVPIAPGGGNTIESLSKFAATNPEDLGYGFWARMGSPLSQTTDDLNAILKQGEAFKAQVITDADKRLRTSKRKLWGSERQEVENVFSMLRDGEDSYRKVAYTADEFKKKFYVKNGKEPTDKQVDYYLAAQEHNDAAYFIQADIEFKDQVNRGVQVLQKNDAEFRVIGTDAAHVPDGDFVWDFEKGKPIRKDELTKGQSVFSMADETFETPFGEHVQFVATRSPTTRRLYHTDVLGYNPGGARVTTSNQANWFVKQNREVSLIGSRKVSGHPVTGLSTKIREEAVKATDELNAISKVVAAKVNKDIPFDQYLDDLRKLDGDKDILDVLENNFGWNPAVQVASDIADFSRRTGIDLRKKVDFVHDGALLIDEPTSYLPGIKADRNWAESFQIGGMRKGSRKETPLQGYGGEVVPTVPALASIEKNFASVVASRSDAAYVSAAINGLMKGLLENPRTLRKQLDNNIVGMPLKKKLSELRNYIDPEEGKKFLLEIDKIEWRMKKRPDYAVAFERWKNDLANKLYGKGFKSTAAKLDWMSTDPITAMRGYAFHFWLGLFAWDQVLVQGSQIFNIISMAPTSGIRGAALYAPTRFAVLNGNKEVLERTAKFVAPVVGMKPKQYVEMVELLKESGRLVTGMSIAELGEDAAMSGFVKGALSKATFFFDEGELIARITAHNTAYLKYIKRFPDTSPMSQHGRRWIAHEQDRLTQAMTSASKSPYQQAPGLQFLTYSWRMGEAMLAGSFGGSKTVLTKSEKLGMLAGHTALYGLAGLPGIGYMADRLYAKNKVEVDPETYFDIRYGILDMIVSNLMEAETSLSGRIAWGEGVAQTISSLMDAKIIEAVAGPSGGLTQDWLGLVVNLIKSINTGHVDLIQEDTILLARQMKSVDMIYNSYMAQRYGVYLSKTGGLNKDDVSKNEAVALAFGIPLAEMSNTWRLNSMMYKDSKMDKKIAKEIKRHQVQFALAVKDKDWDKANTFGKVIAAIIASLPPEQQLRVDRKLPKGIVDLQGETIYYALMNGYKPAEVKE